MPLNTLADLVFDQLAPNVPGLVLPVTATADGSAVGTLRSAMVGRPNKQVLRWQAFRPDGSTAGPIWEYRTDAAMDFLTPEAAATLRQQAAKEAQSLEANQ